MTILIADHDSHERERFEHLTKASGRRVVSASSEKELHERIMIVRPTILVLDAHLDPGAMAIIKHLKEEPTSASVPILVASSSNETDLRQQALAMGATDYLLRPYQSYDVEHRLAAVEQWHDEAARARRVAADVLDPTTPTGTPQELLISLEYEFMRAERYERPVSCIVVRVDNLATLTQHSAPDHASLIMQQVDLRVRSCVRMIDHLFRTSATEFTVILPETDRLGAETVRRRIAEDDTESALGIDGPGPTPHVRVAASSFPTDAVQSGSELHQIAKSRYSRPPA